MPPSQAVVTGFDQDSTGALPQGWLGGSTGGGSPRWTVETDASAPSLKVLKQSGYAPFCWCVAENTAIADGLVEVAFKPLSGREDQAGGVVWRWQDGGNYYVARANAMENNVSLYYTQNGSRRTLKYVNAPVASNVWHVLRVEFSGPRIRVSLNGKLEIAMEDNHITRAGAVGVWTKADSVTLFHKFTYNESAP